MNQFKGTGVALVTPFHEDLSLDLDGLKRLIDHVIQGGVDYLVVLGTTGETATLTKEEKKLVLTTCVSHTANRVPIMLGIGGNNTLAVIEEIESTDFSGVSAILSVSPYYNKPSQAGIIAHYQAVATAAPVPVMLYNIPGRTMSNMTAATTLELAQHPSIFGIKEASGNLEQCMRIAAGKPVEFLLVSGDDLMTKALSSIGGAGIISVLANALPTTFRTISHGTDAEQLAETFSLLDLNELMYQEGNPVGIKNLLKHIGICGDQVRLPMLRASKNLNDIIKATFDRS